ncbi:ABC transporter substrate-binding protein [Intrasporangium oryzae NRRL B-24470]|uniref:ABC transporter substrate-binding protein n=1 Tax=Intrasporangium oryzae NRRL B-24470 TaxID=1386089 RepID=W9GDZ4_9MICO|nr:ABC transporter substrate-binding protein [Intrasporangium oryzae]EWT02074.1 ABC transporter substrate-binding protein [Intrasporangium oryzae NRRL B-24470]
MTARPISVLAALAAGAVLLSGCGGPTSAEETTPSKGASAAAPVTVAGIAISVDGAARKAVPQKFLDAGTVRVATDVPYAPFEMFVSEGSQDITGVDHDLGQAIGAKLGVKFVFTPQKFDGIIPAVQAGKFDAVISAMTDKKERQAALTFVDYSASGTGVLVAKGNPEKITTYTDLCGKKVAVQAATNQLDLATAWQKECTAGGKGEIQIQQFPKDSDAQLAIKAGKVVAALATKPAAGYSAKTTDNGNAFEVVNDPAAPTGYQSTPNGIGVANKDKELATAIQLALQSLMDDGSYTKILATYGVEGIAIDKATINAATS